MNECVWKGVARSGRSKTAFFVGYRSEQFWRTAQREGLQRGVRSSEACRSRREKLTPSCDLKDGSDSRGNGRHLDVLTALHVAQAHQCSLARANGGRHVSLAHFEAKLFTTSWVAALLGGGA